MHKTKIKTKPCRADLKRISHLMSDEQKAKALKASGVLTAQLGEKFTITDAINHLFEKGYDVLEIDKAIV